MQPDAAEFSVSDPSIEETLASLPSDHDTVERSSLQLGNYEIIDEIARGGMGVVYRARQINADRIVALKLIRGTDPDPKELERFESEAKAAAKLDHPNIVPIYDVGLIAGEPFFTMKLVEGESLSGKLDGKPIEARVAARIVRDVAAGISHAHQNNIIHRDLKPGNVLLDFGDNPLVTDFGLAKLSDDESDLTRTGQAIGTPAYMPPEQASGDRDKIDHRSDVYSLGALLYACLTGRPPFQGASAMATVVAVMKDEPVAPRLLNADVPKDLETICLKCLEKESKDRYQTALDLHDDLNRYLADEPILARPVTFGERTVKWVRRNPLPTALIAASLIACLGLVTTVISRSYSTQLTSLLDEANQQRKIAQLQQKKTDAALTVAKSASEQRDVAEYKSLIALSQLAYGRASYLESFDFLRRTKPEYRDWEYAFLSQRMTRHVNQLTVDPLQRPVADTQLNNEGSRLAVLRIGSASTIDIHELKMQPDSLVSIPEEQWSIEIPSTNSMDSNVFFVGAELLVSSIGAKSGKYFHWRYKLDHAAKTAERIGQIICPNAGYIMEVSPDGRFAMAGAQTESFKWKNSIQLIRFGDVTKIESLATPGHYVDGCFSFSGDLLYVLVVSELAKSQSIYCFSTETGNIVSTRPVDADKQLRCLAVSGDDKRLLAAGSDRVTTIDAKTLETIATQRHGKLPVSAVCFSHSGEKVFAGHRSGEVSVYDDESLESIRSFPGLSRPISKLHSMEGDRFLLTSGFSHRVVNSDFNDFAWTHTDNFYMGPPTAMAIDSSGRWLASCKNSKGVTGDAWLQLTEIDDLSATRKLGLGIRNSRQHLNSIQWMDFTGDGLSLVTADYFHTLYFWNVIDGSVEKILKLPVQPGMNAASLSDSKTYLATCSYGGHAVLVDLATRKVVNQFKTDEDLRAVCVDEANEQVHAIGKSGTVYSWEIETGRLVGQQSVGFDPPSSSIFLSNSRRWIGGSVTGAVWVLDPRPGLINDRTNYFWNNAHTGFLNVIAASPDGNRCLTACSDGRTLLRDTKTLEVVLCLDEQEQPVTAATFSPDGKLLVTGDNEGGLTVWDASGQ